MFGAFRLRVNKTVDRGTRCKDKDRAKGRQNLQGAVQGEYRRFILTFNAGFVFCPLRSSSEPSFLSEEKLSEA